MKMSATTRFNLVRVLRILLVFTLVFWSSFRIEMLAFADDSPQAESPGAEQPSQNTEDTPASSGESEDPGQGGEPGESSPSAESPSSESPSSDSPASSGAAQPSEDPEPTTTFQNLEVHLLNENPPANSTDPLKHVGAFVYDSNAQSPQGNKPKIDTVEGELKFVPVIVKKDGSKLDASGLVEWSVEGGVEAADFTDAGGKKSNVLKAKGKEDAEVTAICRLKSDAFSQFDLPAGSDIFVKFRIDVMEQAGAYVESVELLDKDGNVLKASDTLKLDLEDGKPLSYQFGAKLTVRDPAPSANPATHTISTMDVSGLNDRDKELLESLEWSVADEEDASIDKAGLFKTSTKLETTVICTTAKGHGGASVSATTIVNTGIDPDVQGASHPQDTLLVIAPSEVVKVADDAANDAANAGAGESGSSAAANPSSSSAAASDEDTPASGAAADAEGEGAGSENADAKPKPDPISKPYSLDELSSLGWSTATVTLQGRNSTAGNAAGSSDNTTTITGAGPSLVAILEDAGVDLTKVRSVTFVNYQGDTQTISWSGLGGQDSTAMLAANSLVHVEGEAAPSGEEGLLKNTRYRLLVRDGVSIDSALPWINTIRVNGDGSGSGGSGTTDSSLRAVIGYIPVAKGNTAILSASVVGLYQGEQFGYEWESSPDGGVTWSPTGDTSQTLRVPTSDGTIGRMYRVVATTNSKRKAESDPVTISENTGFSVALAYDPPLAGEIAFFTTSVTGVQPTEITDYIWEWTEDGGTTWQEIAGSRGNPTFSAKTDPVSSSSGGESQEEGAGSGSEGDGSSSGSSSSASPEKEVDKTPAPSMWVHVRVLATGGREAVSNPVMLTVHVSEDPGNGQVPTEDIPEKLPDEPSAPGTDDPKTPTVPEKSDSSAAVDPTKDVVETNPEPAAPTPVVTEVSSITTETAPRSTAQSTTVTSETPATEQRPDGTQTAPTPESAPSESQADLIINPEVTAEILQQQEAVSQVVQSTHPGARWTALSTVEPDGKDVQRILSENPFVPLTAPFALGITAAGFVEKLFAFRRQIK